ncbi:MAG: ABC transporter substrate-binding protein, partial [Hyphomicrobium sp.]
FENSDMKASGLPSQEELTLLAPFKDQLPKEVWGEPSISPVTDGSGLNRDNLRKASLLLSEGGWKLDPKDRKLKNEKGETFAFEILIDSAAFERVAGPYVKNLKNLGIEASIRRADPAQFELRMKTFDFDMTVQRYSLRLTPSVELKNFWGSEAAATDGSFNLAGISDPVVDRLIEQVIKAKTRFELVNATRALDRVLRAGHYWVPHWFKASHHLAFWNKLSWPPQKPKYDRGALVNWWFDEEKAQKLKSQ